MRAFRERWTIPFSSSPYHTPSSDTGHLTYQKNLSVLSFAASISVVGLRNASCLRLSYLNFVEVLQIGRDIIHPKVDGRQRGVSLKCHAQQPYVVILRGGPVHKLFVLIVLRRSQVNRVISLGLLQCSRCTVLLLGRSSTTATWTNNLSSTFRKRYPLHR